MEKRSRPLCGGPSRARHRPGPPFDHLVLIPCRRVFEGDVVAISPEGSIAMQGKQGLLRCQKEQHISRESIPSIFLRPNYSLYSCLSIVSVHKTPYNPQTRRALRIQGQVSSTMDFSPAGSEPPNRKSTPESRPRVSD